MNAPLTFVRSDVVYSRHNDFKSPIGRCCESLVLDAIGYTWIATGERDANGRLLYRVAPRCCNLSPECIRHARGIVSHVCAMG